MTKKMPHIIKVLFSLCTAVVLITVCTFGFGAVLKSLYPLKYTEFVEAYAEKNNLDKNFVYAVIECESGFNPDAVSSTGAVGLMQIMPDTFNWISGKLQNTSDFTKASDPETNISYGCWFYGYLTDKYENEATAVAAYHAGMTNVDKWLSDKKYSLDGKTLHSIPFPSTEKYVERVIRTKNIYSKLYSR